MDNGNTYINDIMTVTDVNMGERENILDRKTEKEINLDKKKRAQNKDRSDGELSEADFMALSRAEQLAIAEKYWNGRTDTYDDDKKFKFSYTHLGTLCERLGFRKGIVDTKKGGVKESKLYIEHGRRGNTVEKKVTFSEKTISKFNDLLGKENSLSNIERSKILDAILLEALENKLAAKNAGAFSVAYKPVKEEILI